MNPAQLRAMDACEGVHALLVYIGENPDREGLRDTPKRVAKAYAEMCDGYDKDPAELMRVFEDGACQDMVILKDIEFTSLCEHHMLPFIGVAHIAYIPNGRVLGVSKLSRLLDMYAHRLQIQERIGQQVTEALMTHLEPLGAACIIEAKHQCMLCRGVRKQQSSMITSSLVGAFKDEPATRAELFSLITASR